MYVDRHVHGPLVGGPGAVRAGVGVAQHPSIMALADQPGVALEGDLDTSAHLVCAGRLELERDDRVGHVGRVYGRDLFGVLFGREPDDGGRPVARSVARDAHRVPPPRGCALRPEYAPRESPAHPPGSQKFGRVLEARDTLWAPVFL